MWELLLRPFTGVSAGPMLVNLQTCDSGTVPVISGQLVTLQVTVFCILYLTLMGRVSVMVILFSASATRVRVRIRVSRCRRGIKYSTTLKVCVSFSIFTLRAEHRYLSCIHFISLRN